MSKSMNKVAISVIIPVYNAGDYLDRCLKSILSQDFSSYEVILVDDGSTDSSSDICDRYSLLDKRFVCKHKQNGGVSSARNCGLSMAEGEYVMFVDSDDALAKNALSTFYDTACNSSPDFIMGAYDVYTDNVYDRTCGPQTSSLFNKEKMSVFFEKTVGETGELFRSPWAKLYRRSVILDNSLGFNEALSYAEDKLFVYGFLNHAESAASVDVPVYEYYRHSGSLSWGKTDVKRAAKLLDMIPYYSESLSSLMEKYPDSDALRRVLHNDLFCGDIMRVFRVFMKFRTPLLTHESVGMMYSVMSSDRKMKLMERRVPGQVLVSFFHVTGLKSLSVCFFRITASVLSFFRS